VLVVDDNSDEAGSLVELVNLWGYTTEVALTGPEALSAYSTFDPDIILLDIGIPILNGYEVARKIRRQSGRDRPFLVALTGDDSMEAGQRALASGIDAHLPKPVDLAQLQALLSQYSGMMGVTEI
jgi:CheY-like chemotaxis protein